MMRLPKAFRLFLVLLTLSGSLFSQSKDPNFGIIPAPQSIVANGEEFVLGPQTQIQYQDEAVLPIAQMLQEILLERFHWKIPIQPGFTASASGAIRIQNEFGKENNSESYYLLIKSNEVIWRAKDAGSFYALQSFVQLLPETTGQTIKLAGLEITDWPRYKYRGMHLDVARHYFPVSFIKKYIDFLAQYKFNTFHWHLTDDQGWRIEIKKYPRLTEIGAYRAQTLVGNFHDRFPQLFDGTPYGGYYTQEEIKEVVAYAQSRFINVIPEIEMPGHALAALSAYPELACGDKPGPFQPAEKWGVFDDVFCAGKEQPFHFLQDVLTEVMALFPSNYIHIGGDECPKARWKTCKYCQKRIRDNKLKDEHELQSYYIRRIEKFVNSKGRRIIGWDEILEGGLAPNATVMSWRGVDGGIAAAKMGHDAIMTPGSSLYFDHVQGKSNQEPLSIGGNNPLQKVYSYNPTPPDLPVSVQNRIIGVQANMWTEYMTNNAKVEYMLLPRLFALAEIAWTYPERKDWQNFSTLRVPEKLAILDKSTTLYRVPTAIGAKDTTLLGEDFTFELTAPVKGAKIYYTLDGYTPDATTQLYEAPIKVKVPLNMQRVLKTRVITPSGKQSAYSTTMMQNASAFQPIQVERTSPGLNYWFIPGNINLTQEIDTLKATERGQVNNFNLAKFRTKSRTFALQFEGYIQVVEDGIYSFTTTSDDGSTLWIDDQLVVDNDEKHASFSLTGGVKLLKGFHKLQLRYFQAGGSAELRVWMSGPNGQRTEIPAGLLSH